MKQVITLKYEVTLGPEDYGQNTCIIPHVIEYTLPGDANLSQIIDQLELFIKGMGYFPPANCHLEYVEDEDVSVEKAHFEPKSS